MRSLRSLFITTLLVCSSLVAAQQIGTNTAEVHPPLTTYTCTTSGGCTAVSSSVVLDANWRWVHTTDGYTDCYSGNEWDTTICPDPVTCATSCAVDGADYSSTYGVTTSSDELNIGFVTGSNVGSRLYLMESETEYQMFNLKNQEFTFDVNVANLPCGLNGALYFVEMSADGGLSAYPNNKAGAQYGTGYCDAQCPQDLKFINGAANVIDWTPSTVDSNSGTGFYGTCCIEMDIWEANKISAALTPHSCSVAGQTQCSGTECGSTTATRYDGYCDEDGCDFNSYRMGNTTFYGPSLTIDTTKLFTVVTQFITSDGTSAGDLTEIKRLYVQDGVIFENSYATFEGVDTYNSITDDFCAAQKTLFGDTNEFATLGGLTAMGEAFERGMVLVMSLWDDYAVDMLWLDSVYPTTADASTPGVARGTCAAATGTPAYVEGNFPSANVQFSNIRSGDIGSTFTGTYASGSAPASTTPTSTAATTSTTGTKASTTTATAATTSTTGTKTSPTSTTASATTASATSTTGAASRPATTTTTTGAASKPATTTTTTTTTGSASKPATTTTTSGCDLSITQSVTSSWTSGNVPNVQIAVTVTNTGASALTSLSLTIANSAALSQIWSVGTNSDGTYGLPSYMPSLAAGSSITFGYIAASSAALAITSNCASATTTPASSGDSSTSTASASSTTTSTCTAGISFALTSVWDNGGVVAITISNTGSAPIKSALFTVPGGSSISGWNFQASSTAFGLPSYALPLAVGASFNSAGYSYTGTQPAAGTIVSVSC